MNKAERKQLALAAIIGHRGCRDAVPENTLAALHQAHLDGATWVEFDVKLTRDGKLIVFHDDDLMRTTNGQGLVVEHDYSTIQLLDAGSWVHTNFKNERVPLFSDYLQRLAELNLAANIEIKPNQQDGIATARAILDLLMTVNLPLENLLLSCFDWTVLQWLYDQGVPYHLGVLADDWQCDPLRFCRKIEATSLHINHQVLTQEIVTEIKATGLLLATYTVNDPARAAELFEWGVDAIFTDYPAHY